MSMDSKSMDPRVKPEDDEKTSWIPGSSPRMTNHRHSCPLLSFLRRHESTIKL
jgi:hypothetical protein